MRDPKTSELARDVDAHSLHRLVRRLWFSIKPTYRTVEGRAATYEAADKLIRETGHLEDPNRWDIWPEREDHNQQIGVVFIRRRERVCA